MDSADLDRLAKEVRARARLKDDELERAPEIIVRILGPRSIAVSRSMRCAGRLDRDERGYVIVVREGARDMNFTLAHELAHWALIEIARFKGPRLAEERAANYVAAAILAPKRSVQRASKIWDSLPEMAEAFGLAKTSMNLRLGEVLHDDRFVVTVSGNVLRRDSMHHLTDEDIRAEARSPVRRNLAKTYLRGGIDEGRVAMVRVG